MIVEQLSMRGVGDPFRTREVALDFRAIPAGSVIAFVGANGAGKTTCLELLCGGTLDRELSSYRDPKAKRGESIVTHVAPDCRDAFVETVYRLSLGTVTFRINLDGKRGKLEPYVTTSWDQRTVGPIQKEVDEVRAKLFPSRGVLLSGPFACQGGYDGFFRLGPSERKEIFLEMLGVEHLEEDAEAARAWAKATLDTLAKVREKLQDVAGRVGRARELDALLGALAPQLAEAETAVTTATAARAHAQANLADAERVLAAASTAAAHTAEERTRLTAFHDATVSRRDGLATRLAALATLLMDAAAIRAAAAELPGLDTDVAALDREREAYAAALAPLTERIAIVDAQRQQLVDRHRTLATELAAAEQAAREIAASTLDADVATKQVTLAGYDTDLARFEAMVPELEGAASIETRTIGQRHLLTLRRQDLAPRTTLLAAIPNVPACATCPLTADAQQAQTTLAALDAELATLPVIDGTPTADALRLHHEALETTRRARQDVDRWITAQQPERVRLGVLRETAGKVEALRTALADVDAQGATVRATLDTAKAERTRLTGLDTTATEKRAALTARRTAIAPMAAKLPEIAVAASQQTDLETQRTASDAAIAETEAALTALPVSTVPTATTSVEAARTELATAHTTSDAAEQAARAIRDERAQVVGERHALGDPVTEQTTLQAREAKLVVEASDWALLERGLGKTGIQAMIVDAAGPEVSALANDLLATCYTPRFQIQLTTTVPRADGKGVKEVFEARILDADANRDGTHGSGGETALIDAALRLATVIVNTRRSGFELQTLWLDEASAALSEENAPKYVAMVRRAMAIGHFHHAFVVSHDRAVWEAADVQFYFDDGAIRSDLARAA